LAHRSLSLVLRENGDLAAATAELRLAVAQLPDDAEGHHILGTVLLKSDDLNGAIEEFRRAVALNPDLAQAAMPFGRHFAIAGQKTGMGLRQIRMSATARRNSSMAPFKSSDFSSTVPRM